MGGAGRKGASERNTLISLMNTKARSPLHHWRKNSSTANFLLSSPPLNALNAFTARGEKKP